MKINKYSILLSILVLFSFFIRIYNIANLSLFGDEIDIGYQAFSILNTGRDYKNNFLPTYIQSLAESRAPLLIYFSIPGIKIFGLNELGVRITPIIFGVLSIYLFYQLVLILSRSNLLALISATILSFSPWHFHYSRTAFEVTLLLSLILAGTYYFCLFIKNLKNKYLYFSIVAFGLTFYTYNTANIFTPLIVLYLIISNLKNIKNHLNFKLIISSLILIFIFIIPIFIQILFGQAAKRFSSLNIFNNQTIINSIIEKRTIFSATNQNIEKVFHNKPIAYGRELINNYIQSISPVFLFINGDTLNLRHSIPGFGLIFITFLPFIFLGLLSLNLHLFINKLMLFWLFIAPIPASLTINGGTHATRLFLMTIPISYFISLGIKKLVTSKYSKLIYLCLSLIFLFETSLYIHEYFVHYPQDSYEVWNRGYKEIFQNIPQNYHHLYISNAKYNSLLAFLFYQKYPPQQFIKNNIVDSGPSFNLGQNISFINNWYSSDHLQEISKNSLTGDIFVLFQGNDIPGDMDFSKNNFPGFLTIKTIYNPNNSILAQIIQKL